MIPAVLPTYTRAPLSFVRGEGSWLVTGDGSRYLDLGAGIAVNALGHAHPALVKALTEQAQKLWHTSNLYRIPAQERLAEVGAWLRAQGASVYGTRGGPFTRPELPRIAIYIYTIV